MSSTLLEMMLFLSLLPIYQTSGADKYLEISAPAGTFMGTVLTSPQGHLYRAYMAIPYALPPTGNLRFAKPRPYPKIEGVYDATGLPPLCVQPIGVDLGSPAQEDCLYLNVYLPVDEEDNTNTQELRKVFVYIHGGSFFMGSSREYMPGNLITLGDVIVVTMNYRLSWLGFLKGNTTELPGNQGMWDQLMALTWVKDNIRSFGGDPNDITIGGNSMGGESVSAWSILPHGKGLFTKGYIMSGTMFSSKSTSGSSDILLDLLTDRVGCKKDEIALTVQCLRALPSESFILPHEGTLTNKFTTIDGELFPAPIATLISDEDYLRHVGFYNKSYLVTLTNNEGAVYFHRPTDSNGDQESVASISQKLRVPEAMGEKAMIWYKEPGRYTFKPSYDVVGDPILSMPAFQFLETFASNSKGSSTGKLYFLWFDHWPTYLPSHLEGMGHGLDLPYLFDLSADDMLQTYYGAPAGKNFAAKDYELKKRFTHILVDFMKTGDPGASLAKAFNIHWPTFDLESESFLNFGPHLAVKQLPLKERRYFWKEVFPQYMEDYQKSLHKDEL